MTPKGKLYKNARKTVGNIFSRMGQIFPNSGLAKRIPQPYLSEKAFSIACGGEWQ